MRHDLTQGITREQYMRDIEPTLTRPLSLGSQEGRPPAADTVNAKQLRDISTRPKHPPKQR